jgi:hypothetical protein
MKVNCPRLGPEHGAHDSEPIACLADVQVRDQYIELLLGNQFERFGNCTDGVDCESLIFQVHAKGEPILSSSLTNRIFGRDSGTVRGTITVAAWMLYRHRAPDEVAYNSAVHEFVPP